MVRFGSFWGGGSPVNSCYVSLERLPFVAQTCSEALLRRQAGLPLTEAQVGMLEGVDRERLEAGLEAWVDRTYQRLLPKGLRLALPAE